MTHNRNPNGRPVRLAADTVKVGLQLRERTDDRLKERAKARGLTKSELADKILWDALRPKGRVVAPEDEKTTGAAR